MRIRQFLDYDNGMKLSYRKADAARRWLLPRPAGTMGSTRAYEAEELRQVRSLPRHDRRRAQVPAGIGVRRLWTRSSNEAPRVDAGAGRCADRTAGVARAAEGGAGDRFSRRCLARPKCAVRGRVPPGTER